MPTVTLRPAPSTTSAAPRVAGAAAAPALLPDGTPAPLVDEFGNPIEPPAPRYDLPPGSRRMLSRVGPLTSETGTLPMNAFGNRGQYVTILMDQVKAPIVSRWGSILLRRTLLSAVNTPDNVNGADFVAARAWLLLRQGESAGARMLVQSVDIDKASDRLRNVAMQVFLANADPAGMCPYVPAMIGGRDPSWSLAQAMCSGLVGEPGPAGAVIDRVRRSGRLDAIDVKLAEKVVGAGFESRRAAVVKWDGVTQLTPWRFGLATATGVAIPDELWATASPAMRSWAVQAPMLDVNRRLGFAPGAARRGTLSSRAYVDLVSFAASLDEPPAAVATLAGQVRLAFVAAELQGRVATIAALSSVDQDAYAGRVLAARAAARVGPVAIDDETTAHLLQAMFAGGLDRNAMAWASKVRVGSQAWGLLAVGSPRPLVGVTADQVDDYASDDSSENQQRTKMLAAALIGLGRVNGDEARTLAEDYELGLGTSTLWTRGIETAAERGEAGTVALIAAIGLQTDRWDRVPAYHLYHITNALRRVGLGAEARMIAAEALSRI